MSKLMYGECGGDVKTYYIDHQFVYGVGKGAVKLSVKNIPIRTCCECGFTFLDFGAEEMCDKAVSDYKARQEAKDGEDGI